MGRPIFEPIWVFVGLFVGGVELLKSSGFDSKVGGEPFLALFSLVELF